MAVLIGLFGVGGVGKAVHYIANLRDQRRRDQSQLEADTKKVEAEAKQELGRQLGALTAEVFELRVFNAAILERDRRRDEKRKREDTPAPVRRGAHVAHSASRNDFESEGTTNVDVIADRIRQEMRPAIERRKTPAPGVPIVRAGTQRDEDR